MKKILLPLLLVSIVTLSSCSYKSGDPVVYHANPVFNSEDKPVELYKSEISLTAYNQRVLDKVSPLFQEVVEDIHKDSDRYNYYKDANGELINNIKVVNDSYGKSTPIKISDNLYELLDLSIELHELSEGYFNPTMGSLIDLWSDTIPTMPGYGVTDIVGTPEFDKAFSEMIPYSKEDPLSNYIVLNEQDKTVTFKKYKDIENIDISLGGIAKGYGMYKATEALKGYKYPMMIDGGSSSLALINDHPKNKNYTIGVSSPYNAVNGTHLFGQKILYAASLEKGTNISTSGDYLHYAYITDKPCVAGDEVPCKRLTEDLGDGKFRYIRRHHILNPFTGVSENNYRVINVHADGRADVLDALTTSLFNIDINKDKETFLRIVHNFEKAYNIQIEFLLEQEFSFYKEDGTDWSNLDIYMSEGMDKSLNREFKPQIDVINSETIIKK